MAVHRPQYLYLQYHNDIDQHYQDITALLHQDIKLHFTNVTHQNVCVKQDDFMLLMSGTHPSAQIITIDEVLRDSITALVNSFNDYNSNTNSESEEEENSESDEDEDSVGPTHAGDQMCPICRHDK